MARFQEISVINDQRPPAARHVVQESIMDHLKNPPGSGLMDLPAEKRVPKARKPYTISKQREKWTEDEHKLFLESLQLHGRAWRRIQEHIGSKTAVQIRSHAQKFFSKIIRESSGDGNSVSAAPQIQIPPPRPKRKPAHPYPRKLGNSPGKDVSALKQLERPQLQKQSLCEQVNGSPKSVLTTSQIGSETLFSDSAGSPASSVDVEDRCSTPRIAAVEVAVQVPSSKDDNGNAASKDVACGIPEGSVLRLFGKRVVVNDLHQDPNPNTWNLQNAADMELDASAETPTSGNGRFSSSAAEANTWNPWLTGTQLFMYCLPQSEVFSVHSTCQLFGYDNGSTSCAQMSPQSIASNKQQQYLPSRAADCKFTRGEGSWTDLITTSSSAPETTTQNSDAIESIQVNNNGGEKINVPGSRICVNPTPLRLRGFVPYRKWAAESKLRQSQELSEEDGEMTKLCL